MASFPGQHLAATGLTFWAFPANQTSFANWNTLKIQLVDSNSIGSYIATLNDTNGLLWLVFQGDDTPTLMGAAVAKIDFDGTIAAIKADAELGTATGGMVANAEAIKAKTDLVGTIRSLIRW